MKTVLIIDDDNMILGVFGQILPRLGYEVVLKESPIDGVETFLADPDNFDLIITDQTMDEMSGDEVCQTVREVKDVPVIKCTGNQPEGVEKFVLCKPFSINEVEQLLKEALGGSND